MAVTPAFVCAEPPRGLLTPPPMMCRRNPLQNSPVRGMTMVEILVAVTVTLILVGSVSAAFIQVIRASDEAQSQVRAHNSARSAVDAVAQDLRQLQLDPDLAYQTLVLSDAPVAYGDRIDNDLDGSADEELFDGLDDDGDWTALDDRHLEVAGRREREAYVGRPDFGDARVDEDCHFSADEITFIIPGTPRKRVSYRIGTFDGVGNVLLKVVTLNPPATPPYTETIEPVVFDVVSFDVMAWNPNNDVAGPLPGEPYWQGTWDASTLTPGTVRPLNSPNGTPAFKLPAAFLISITTNAERKPLSEMPDWRISSKPLKTATVSTVVTVESIAQDARYFVYLRD